jgi:DNA-binding CsgD family transcriptional regulator
MRATLYPELVEKIEGLGRRGQVLAGIWAGKGTKEIAADMGVSPKTVEYHRAQLYRVFGVNDLVSLCRRAIALGLIDPKAEGRSEGCLRQCLTQCLRQCPRMRETGRSGTSQPERRARASSGYAKN